MPSLSQPISFLFCFIFLHKVYTYILLKALIYCLFSPLFSFSFVFHFLSFFLLIWIFPSFSLSLELRRIIVLLIHGWILLVFIHFSYYHVFFFLDQSYSHLHILHRLFKSSFSSKKNCTEISYYFIQHISIDLVQTTTTLLVSINYYYSFIFMRFPNICFCFLCFQFWDY